MAAKQYLAVLLVTFICWILLVVGVNVFVDPYAIFPSPSIKGFNAFKPALPRNERRGKILGAAAYSPDVLLLGISRTAIGINPWGTTLHSMRAFNLAFSAQTNYESRRLLERHAERMRHKNVFLGLDFPFSNALVQVDHRLTDAVLSRPDWNNEAKVMLSVGTLLDSVDTVWHQEDSSATIYPVPGARSSHEDSARNYVRKEGGHRNLFLANERAYAEGYLTRGYSFEAPNGKQRPLSELHMMFRIAYANDIKLHAFISPSHARQWEVNGETGLWSSFEEWKRHLARINEEEAALAHRPAYPVWDFSGYGAINSEPVPPASDTETLMHWYWESSHYRESLGEVILQRMLFGTGDFGALLTTATIEPHLASLRAARSRYRSQHPEDVAEIVQIVESQRLRARK